MKLNQIQKLYLSNFLTGLVFWYGIEKLFMKSIGIDAVGVGLVSAISGGFLILFEIPAGMLADKWSRKGMLMVSAVCLGVSSTLLGLSNSLSTFIIGVFIYCAYLVSTNGTYQAIMYDSMHEEGRTSDYSKIAGRAYALFLAGSGVANVASGFIAHSFNFQATFFISIVPCVLNLLVMSTLREPRFHKSELGEKVLSKLKTAATSITQVKLLRILAIVLSSLTIIEVFKTDFGQLYMLRYVSDTRILGVLWAGYAFTWSLGSLIAHRFRAKLDVLIIVSILPLVLMSVIDSWFSIVLYMVQAVAIAALFNQIETRVQENVPSEVRASSLSVLTEVGHIAALPASFALGWIFRDYNQLWGLRAVAVVASLTLAYWLWSSRGMSAAHKANIA